MPDTQSTTTQPTNEEIYREVQESRSTGVLFTANMGVDAIQGYVVIPDE
jgi:hypothetical protein